MSNHSGSYMLNDVLRAFDKMGIKDKVGIEVSREFLYKVLEIGEQEDCNRGEILDGVAKRYGVCSYCFKDFDVLKTDYCDACNNELGYDE